MTTSSDSNEPITQVHLSDSFFFGRVFLSLIVANWREIWRCEKYALSLLWQAKTYYERDERDDDDFISY